MSMLEVIDEIKHNLEDMREAKKEIKTALEDKFKKPIGNDFTKYSQKINEVWAANEKIQVGENAIYTFGNPSHMSNNLFDFSNTKNFTKIITNEAIKKGALQELEDKIEISIRDVDNTYNFESMFEGIGNSGNPDISKWFKIIGIPKYTDNLKSSIFSRIFSYADWIPFYDGSHFIDEEIDCKGRVFSLGDEYFNYNNVNVNTHLPTWFCTIFPYCNNFGNIINEICNLTENIELTVAKEQDLTNTSDRAWFYWLKTSENIHIYVENDFYTNSAYCLFYRASDGIGCPKTFRVDGPGKLIFTNSSNGNRSYVINRFGTNDFKIHRLEIKLCMSENNTFNNDFSNVEEIEFLDGSEWYSVSNLPWKTQTEWIDFFNSLPDNSSSTYQNTIKISSDYYNLLTEDDILISTQKGYIITSV